MLDADAIEAINFEQLATLTDKLLLRNSRRAARNQSRLPATAGTPAHGVPADRFDVPSLAPRDHHKRSKSRIATTVHGHRPARAVTAPAPHLPFAPSPPVVPSWEPLARGSQPNIGALGATDAINAITAADAVEEQTIVVRSLPRPDHPAARRAHAHWVARTIVIPALLGAIAGLIALM